MTSFVAAAQDSYSPRRPTRVRRHTLIAHGNHHYRIAGMIPPDCVAEFVIDGQVYGILEVEPL